VGIEVLVGGTGVSGSEGVLVGTTGVFVGRPAVGVTPNSGFASTWPQALQADFQSALQAADFLRQLKV